jgi:predicted enzyme related to lactoylglutathione lyase
MPGHVVINETELEDLGDGRTRLIVISLFSSREDRDGMLQSGMEGGMNESYRALDRVLDGAAPAPRPGVLGAVQKVAFTMYPIHDAARARAFYEDTLGLAVGLVGGQGDMHWIEYDLPGGGCLALTNTTRGQPSAAAGGTIALEVTDLPALVAHLKARGVTFTAEAIRGPHCQMAVCLDSEGNALLLHQLDAPTPPA